MISVMDKDKRRQLNEQSPFMRAKVMDIALLSPRLRAVASSTGLGEAIEQRRTSKAAARAKGKAARASRKRNRR